MKRLIRKQAEDDLNSESFNYPMGIYFKDDWNWTEPKNMNGLQYGPSQKQEWEFEKDVENAEWMLRDCN